MPLLKFFLSESATYLLKNWRYVLIGIIAAVIGFQVHSCVHSCPKCPEIKPSVVTRYDTVKVKDTARGSVPVAVVSRVTFRKVVRPVIQPAVIEDTTPAYVPDTSYCYEAQWSEKDGAAIGIKVCSVILPQTKPPDWTLQKSYVAPPRIEKTIMVTDTIYAPRKRWVLSIGAQGGYGYGAFGWSPQIGVGLQIGYKLGEF